MPRYYCDYCEVYLTHGSFRARRQHIYGWKHRENVKLYYQPYVQQMPMRPMMPPPPMFGGMQPRGMMPPMMPPRGMMMPPRGMMIPPRGMPPRGMPPGFQMPPRGMMPPTNQQVPPAQPPAVPDNSQKQQQQETDTTDAVPEQK
jgi:U1 small nuclear ribonucleoprotein C